jgi:hypothetical protein
MNYKNITLSLLILCTLEMHTMHASPVRRILGIKISLVLPSLSKPTTELLCWGQWGLPPELVIATAVVAHVGILTAASWAQYCQEKKENQKYEEYVAGTQPTLDLPPKENKPQHQK